MIAWAITAYFNPQRARRRYANYQVFRQALALPLLTVEWSPDGRFELGPDDADRVLHIDGGDLMWQKERLLNAAVAALPGDCDTVAWLDCDVLFPDTDWVAQLEGGLRRASMLQLFSQVVHLPPESPAAPPGADGPRGATLVRTALARTGAADIGAGTAADHPDAAENAERHRLARRPSSGHAWAARRELLSSHTLYDACVGGVGDMAIALAALGRADRFIADYPLNAAQVAHYLSWAEPFARAVGGRVDCLPGPIYHLFHGHMVDRQYRSRLAPLAAAGFDPRLHLAAAERGPWEWSGRAESMRLLMAEYFAGRREDAA
jgi:hypothetical protein